MFFTNEETNRFEDIYSKLILCKCKHEALYLNKKLNEEITRAIVCNNDGVDEDEPRPCHKDGSAYAEMVGA